MGTRKGRDEPGTGRGRPRLRSGTNAASNRREGVLQPAGKHDSGRRLRLQFSEEADGTKLDCRQRRRQLRQKPTKKRGRPKATAPQRYGQSRLRVERKCLRTGEEPRLTGAAKPDTLLTIADMQQRVSLSRGRIYELMAKHEFPRPVRVNSDVHSRAVRWRESEIDEWIRTRPIAKGDLG